MRTGLVLFALLGLCWPAAAQVFPNIPGNTIAASNVADNGDFQWAQRGSTWNNVTTTIKVADRWRGSGESTTNNSFTQTAVVGTENSFGSGHAIIIQRAAAETRNTTYSLYQALSTEESQPFAGQQVTLTVWARSGSSFSGAGLLIKIIASTGTDQSGSTLGTWTGQTTVASSSCPETPVTSACSITATLPLNETQLAVSTSWTSSGTAGADDKVVIYGVDLSTTLADLLTLPVVAKPFSTMRAALRRWSGEEFEDGGGQSRLRRWAADSFFPASLF